MAPSDGLFQLLFRRDAGSRTIPRRTNPQIQEAPVIGRLAFVAAKLRPVVVTDTCTLDAAVPLTVVVAGTEQVIPVGAPVQVNVAVPLVRASDRECIAGRLARRNGCGIAPPCGIPRPMLGAAVPVPVRLTVCGELPALSEIWIAAMRSPVAWGEKVTLIEQCAPAAKLVPHVFVCW